MLDIKFIRDNQEAVKKAIKDKGINLNLDEFLDLDARRRDFLTEMESLKATKNKFSKEIAGLSEEEKKVKLLEMKEVDDRETQMKSKLNRITGDYERLMSLLPNIPSVETPVGPDESANVPWSYWSPSLGNVDPKDKDAVEQIPTKFNFEPKDHVFLAKNLDLLDTERGVKISGFRGYYLKNEAVLMQYGLIWHALKKMREKGFTLMVPPVLVKEFALFGSGHFPFGREQIYGISFHGQNEEDEGKVKIKDELELDAGKKDPLYLAGTSEPSLLAYYSDTTISEKDLPIKLCGVSSCYRSEIGSYGKDAKGLYRVHEFMKVEQMVICSADTIESENWLEKLREISQEMLMDLKLPHRVLNICTGDMGAGKYKMYDLETWMPARKGYGETHSDSHLGDWQARRLNIKYKGKDGKSKFAYTLNNTVIASPRILIPILENYQQADGSVVVPEVLKPYVGTDIIKPPAKPK
ncbi:MAG: serine--tRNA ligase [Candidatus Doudnabacteria bacterium CG10_big_fil_rev_8_21_14_0_10_42_18]|uniref:Serine--tRNA ligase n=1 Tax=Candidatus Doudnabacteria bacterium CG10_big_fil_rev_8_21_14_0_10_42_18 TaxID=1974552 RepID=A0A2H0VB23_9BACT|nr:MAG: serine--tRNA ligase [Candidatus Doudnabacteria bacterium CG10_big_fil_rev_8_21_14_0_10_42_18]